MSTTSTRDEFIEFLKELVRKYPELNFLAGPAEATPEGNATLLQEQSLVPKVFTKYDNTAIEGDRTFLGVILFKAVLDKDHSKFPKLSSEKFQKLLDFTHSILQDNPRYIEVVYYSLCCNDLGKTQAIVEENIRLRGQKAADHDRVLLEVVLDNPNLFPGLSTLDEEQQQLYCDGLRFYFNLGQLVQGENFPYSLNEGGQVSKQAKALRLLAEVFDFAGVTGHINNNISMVMTDVNCDLFLQAVETVLESPIENLQSKIEVYHHYFLYRAEKIGLSTEDKEYALIIGKIACLSRSVGISFGDQIVQVWNALSPPTREVLQRELLLTGFETEQKAILIYYFPAVIANAIQATGDFSIGFTIALERVAKVYIQVRERLHLTGNGLGPGVHIENVAGLAKEMTTLPKRQK